MADAHDEHMAIVRSADADYIESIEFQHVLQRPGCQTWLSLENLFDICKVSLQNRFSLHEGESVGDERHIWALPSATWPCWSSVI